jgi:hypothetical protein
MIGAPAQSPNYLISGMGSMRLEQALWPFIALFSLAGE